jgi:hypothetical protein
VVDGCKGLWIAPAQDGCARLLNGCQIARASHALGPLAREGHRPPESAHAYLQSVGARPWCHPPSAEPARRS